MRRDLIRVAVLWIVLTVIGEVVVFTWSMLPEVWAREAVIVDDAYVTLMAFAVPVLAFVLAAVFYSIVRFRSDSRRDVDGPPIKGSRPVVIVWLIVTSLLALTILIYPGFVGLADLRADQSADLVVDVSAQRWFWELTYPNGGVTREELVVPVDTRIRFDVTAIPGDIVHSFWVPAFRVKIDAVPGRTTELYVTPERIGTVEDDPNLRVQCAELCGLGHATMAIPVSVVGPDEFQTWMSGLLATAGAAGGGG